MVKYIFIIMLLSGLACVSLTISEAGAETLPDRVKKTAKKVEQQDFFIDPAVLRSGEQSYLKLHQCAVKKRDLNVILQNVFLPMETHIAYATQVVVHHRGVRTSLICNEVIDAENVTTHYMCTSDNSRFQLSLIEDGGNTHYAIQGAINGEAVDYATFNKPNNALRCTAFAPLIVEAVDALDGSHLLSCSANQMEVSLFQLNGSQGAMLTTIMPSDEDTVLFDSIECTLSEDEKTYHCQGHLKSEWGDTYRVDIHIQKASTGWRIGGKLDGVSLAKVTCDSWSF